MCWKRKACYFISWNWSWNWKSFCLRKILELDEEVGGGGATWYGLVCSFGWGWGVLTEVQSFGAGGGRGRGGCKLSTSSWRGSGVVVDKVAALPAPHPPAPPRPYPPLCRWLWW